MSHRSGHGLAFTIEREEELFRRNFIQGDNSGDPIQVEHHSNWKIPVSKSGRSHSTPSLRRPATAPAHRRPENSYRYMMHGRGPPKPETRQTAGMSVFDMRRWQVTNTSSQFL